MFGMFRRRDRQVRALNASTPAAPTGPYDHLATFLSLHAREVALSSEEKALLMQLAANPPAWSAPLAAFEASDEAAMARRSEPFSATPDNTPAMPPSATGLEETTGGPLW